jgi:hypothetical protein
MGHVLWLFLATKNKTIIFDGKEKVTENKAGLFSTDHQASKNKIPMPKCHRK